MDPQERRSGDAEGSVRQALLDFARAFEQGDIEALSRMFDHGDTTLFYGTHDKLHLIGWPAVEASFRKQLAVLQDLECRITGEIRARIFAGGAAAWAATAGFAIIAMMGDVRVDARGLRLTCTMERHDDGWRFVQMHLSAPDRPFLERVRHVVEEHL